MLVGVWIGLLWFVMGESWKFKMLYDGECPLCMREVGMLRRKDKEGRLAFEDITGEGFDAGAYGVSFDDVYGKIHGVLPNGELVTGVEVFRRVYGELGWGWLVAPTGWPIVRWLFDGLYWVFAKMRPWFSGGKGKKCVEGRCRL